MSVLGGEVIGHFDTVKDSWATYTVSDSGVSLGQEGIVKYLLCNTTRTTTSTTSVHPPKLFGGV